MEIILSSNWYVATSSNLQFLVNAKKLISKEIDIILNLSISKVETISKRQFLNT